jgi:hypothetical protein
MLFKTKILLRPAGCEEDEKSWAAAGTAQADATLESCSLAMEEEDGSSPVRRGRR